MTVVNSKGFPLQVTQQQDVEWAGTHKIWVEGNYENETLMIGKVFESRWKLPIIYYRQQTQNGTKVVEGTLMLRDINLCYADTGYFKAIVTPKYSTNITSEFEYTGKITGTDSATLGKISVSSGTFLLPIIARNEEVEIEIVNDGYLPSCYLSMEWLGDLTVRGQ